MVSIKKKDVKIVLILTFTSEMKMINILESSSITNHVVKMYI